MTTGPINQMVVETDYSDLAEFDRETTTGSSDAEWMKAFRSGIEFVADGTVPVVELLEEAPLLA
jgi:hypothetical protein